MSLSLNYQAVITLPHSRYLDENLHLKPAYIKAIGFSTEEQKPEPRGEEAILEAAALSVYVGGSVQYNAQGCGEELEVAP